MADQREKESAGQQADRIQDLIAEGRIGEAVPLLLDFMRRPEVIEDRRQFTRLQMEQYFAQLPIQVTLKELGETAESQLERNKFDLAYHFLGGMVFGMIFDRESRSVSVEEGISFEVVELEDEKATVVIKHNKPFSEMLVDDERKDLALDRLKEVVTAAMGAYAQLTLSRRYVPFENISEDALDRIYG